MKPKFHKSRSQNLIGASLITAITISFTSSAFATTWVGGTSSDWGNNANWTGGAGTGGSNALIDTTPANIATISANIPATPVDILVGDGASKNGRLIHVAGTATTGANNWMVVGRGGGTGIYDLADTAGSGGTLTGYGLGSGSMTVGNATTNGRLYVGDANGIGTVNVNTSGSLIIRNDLNVGTGDNGKGTFNLDAGTVTTGGWNFIGNGNGAVGTFNQSGGTFTNTGRTYIGGRNSGGTNSAIGHYNISGGTHNSNGNFSVGSGNLTATEPSTLTVSGTGILNTGTVSIGGAAFDGGDANAGKGTATVSGTGTYNVNGELWVGETVGSTGSVTISSGAINVNNWIAVGRHGTGTITQTGGKITKTGGGSISIANFDNAVGKVEVSGGTFDVQTGDLIVGEGGGGTGELLFTGGILNAPRVLIAVNNTVVSTVTLSGGTLTTGKIDGGGAGTSNVTFGGTQIVASGLQPAFITNLDSSVIEAGGLKINSNGFAIGSNQTFTGAGGITKSGAGTLTLTGASSYSGATVVNAGKLVATTDYVGGGSLTVADGARFGVVTAVDGNQLVVSSATLATTAAGAAIDLDLGNFPGNAVDAPLKINGAVVLNGPVTLNVADALPVADGSPIPLVQYGSKTGTGSFVLGTLPLGVVATLQESGGVVSLNVTSVALPRWEGDLSSEWNFTTKNWFDLGSNLASLFTNNSPVLFNDDPQETSSTNVTLATRIEVKPISVTFDNGFRDYTLSGAGKISNATTGTTSLLKKGAATVTISNLNEYTGVTTVQAGTLAVTSLPNGGVASPIGKATASPSNIVLSGGTLSYTGSAATTDRGFTNSGLDNTVVSGLNLASNLTISGQINTVLGKLNKTGPGTLTLTNPGANVLANGSDADNIPPALALAEGGLAFSVAGQTNTVTGRTQFGTVSGLTTTVSLSNGAIYTANGRSFVGMSEGSNTMLTISGTSSYKANGAFQMALANNSVANVIIQDSGSLTKTGGWLSVGNGGNGIGTMTIRNNGSLTADGDFNVGDVDTSVGNLNLEDSATLTTTGPMYIGKNGTTGTVVMSGASALTSANTDVAGGTGSHGNLTIKGTSTYTSNGRLQVGPGAGSVGNMVIEGSGHFVLNSYASVGYNGGGSLTVKNNGTFTNNDDLSVNENGDAPATVTVQDAAAMSVNGNVFVGRNGGKVGTLTVSGTAVFNQVATASSLIVGVAGTGTLNIQGTATVTTGGTAGLLVARDASSVGTVNLDGGTLTARKVSEAGGNSTFYFNGGVLKASTGADLSFIGGLDTLEIKSGGAFINSNGQTIAISQSLTGAGSLIKQGTGSLLLTAATAYTGNTTVSAGTLSLTSATLANTSSVTVATGSVLDLNYTGTDQVAGLTIGGTVLAPGIYGSTTHPGVITGAGKIEVLGGGGATPFDTWIGGFFPGVTDPAIIGKTADPDGDGSSNLLEFALGGLPNSGSQGPKVYHIEADGSVDVGTNKELLLTIAVRSGTPVFSPSPTPTATKDGVTYTIQGSTNLTAFTTGVTPVDVVAPASNPTAPSGYEYRTFSLDGSDNLPNKGFLRVKVN